MHFLMSAAFILWLNRPTIECLQLWNGGWGQSWYIWHTEGGCAHMASTPRGAGSVPVACRYLTWECFHISLVIPFSPAIHLECSTRKPHICLSRALLKLMLDMGSIISSLRCKPEHAVDTVFKADISIEWTENRYRNGEGYSKNKQEKPSVLYRSYTDRRK